MTPTVFNEAEKIWQRLSGSGPETSLQFSVEIHKKLLSFFQPGDFYYYIFNVKHAAFELMSPEVTAVLGYTPEELDIPFLLGKIHPDDQGYFLNFENKVAAFFATLTPDLIPDYKVRYDYRLQKKDGTYLRILQQVVTIEHDEAGTVLRTFGVHTDITAFKPNGKPVLSFIGLNGRPSYTNVAVENVYLPFSLFTGREQEVLALLVQGKNSEEIGKELYISTHTVQAHRKSLLRKTGCTNTAVLVSTAIQKGWV